MEALLSWGTSLWALAPDWVLAAGEKATNLVVVADTRRLSGIMKYFANLYNTNTLLFAIWAVVLTALWGGDPGVPHGLHHGPDRTGPEIAEDSGALREVREWTGYIFMCP